MNKKDFDILNDIRNQSVFFKIKYLENLEKKGFTASIIIPIMNRDFRSICIRMGRRTGATTWTINFAIDLSVLEQRSLLIFDTFAQVQQVKNIIYNKQAFSRVHVMALADYIDSYTNNDYDFIFVDNSALISDSDSKILLDNAKCKLIVFA